MKLKNYLLVLTLVGFVVLVGLFLRFSINADVSPNEISVVPSTNQLEVGKEVTFTVKANVPTGIVAAIDANLNYDKSKLAMVGAVTYFTDLDQKLEESLFPDVGVIHVVVGKNNGTNGQLKVYAVTFRALSAGDASVSIAPYVLVNTNGERMDASANSGSINITNVVVVNPNPDSVPTPTPTPAPTPTPTPEQEEESNSNSDSSASSVSQTTNDENQDVPATQTSKPTKKTIKTPTKSVTTTTVKSKIDTTKSIFNVDKNAAVADGKNQICSNITLKDSSGKVINDIKPTLVIDGQAQITTNQKAGEVWQICIVSKTVGTNKLSVSLPGDIKFGDKSVVFKAVQLVENTTPISDVTAPVITDDSKTAVTPKSSKLSLLASILGIGISLAIVILLIVFYLKRRQSSNQVE